MHVMWRAALLGLVAMAMVASTGAPWAEAHGGGLDANGCHHDRKAGGYHCHRGPGAAPLSLRRFLSPETPREQHRGSKAGGPGSSDRNPVSCGAKRTCGEMTSCAEARFYLEHCGLARLDGDKDGTPCESLCR